MITIRVITILRLGLRANNVEDIPKLPLPEDERDLYISRYKERQASLASEFRNRMTRGQSFQSSNEYRQGFFRDVVERANEVSFRVVDLFHESDRSFKFEKGGEKVDGSTHNSPPRYVVSVFEKQQGVKEAGEELCRFIDPHRLLDSEKGPRRPLIILAFDESYILTDNPKRCNWTLFSELRRTLRGIVNHPIFTLFLSTAGRFHLFSPEIHSDPSRRVTESDLHPLDPISEVSFDDIAFPARKNTVSLDRVVQTDWISHLGRPLYVHFLYFFHEQLLTQASSRFGAYYDALAKNDDELFFFAKQKLLDGKVSLANGNGPGSLACLSVRFGLKFNADPISREVICKQVERHMRLCVAATTGLERLVTLPGSEPLLAEAASQLTRNSTENPVYHLANHSDFNCIDRGLRGELVAELIIMQARDAAVSENRRWMSVCDFMRALLPQTAYEELQSSLPTWWRQAEDKTFTETFMDYAMWFNHVIHVEDKKSINSEHLWMFITRGAMISCTNNQEGVDIVLPICLRNANLSPYTVSAILIQVKNAERYKRKIHKTLFDGMNPLQVGLFNQARRIKPVIRIVFALASDKPGVVFPPRSRRNKRSNGFTAFDIWCAGLSSFNNITERDRLSYQSLLDRSRLPNDEFTLDGTKDQHLDIDTKTTRECQRRRMGALTMSDVDHHQINVGDGVDEGQDDEDSMDEGQDDEDGMDEGQEQ